MEKGNFKLVSSEFHFPKMINDLIGRFITAGTTNSWDVVFFFIVLVVMLGTIVAIIFMEGAQRKITIQYANRPSAATFRGRNDSNIPIKLNTANVIPVIFASTLMSIPATIMRFVGDSSSGFAYWLGQVFDYTSPIGYVLYIVLIVLFTFFYAFVQLNPDKVAENLQNQNAYIPGIKPGVDTSSYVSRILFKITVIGALYLAIIASLPIWMSKIFDLPSSVTIGGPSLIIVVGVATETFKQIVQSTQEDEYRGFLD
jgi:preprotein translocase subunit SecY